VAGTSVGALFGALWASGLDGAEIERIAREAEWFDNGRLAFSTQGLYTNAPLEKKLEAILQGRPIEAWPRRFGAVATQLANGHRRLLTAGSGAVAVQASSAVPAYFRPVVIDGAKLADGALVEPVPVDAAHALGADFVIAIDVAYRPYEETVTGATQYAFQAMHILVNALAEQQLRTADVAIRLDLHRTLATCGRAALIAEGRDAVRRAAPHIARSLAIAAERRSRR
jgi:NTE family protein